MNNVSKHLTGDSECVSLFLFSLEGASRSHKSDCGKGNL